MKQARAWIWVVLAVFLMGCAEQLLADDKDKDDEAKIKASIAKLAPKDRKIATAQRWCAVETDNRLGSMGTPIKLVIKGETVFTCCKGCAKDAKADPDKTLATVKELKAKAKKQQQQ